MDSGRQSGRQSSTTTVSHREAGSSRFVDSAEEAGVFVGNNINGIEDMPPFYNGDLVGQRMDIIRRSIVYIRQNWDQYDHFMENLKKYLAVDEDGLELSGGEDSEEMTLALERTFDQRDWCDVCESAVDDNFSIVRLYTSDTVHKKLFRVIYNIFRRVESLLDEDQVVSAVFLTELINIDLYNFVKVTKTPDFTGTVYKGMTLQPEELQRFEKLLSKDISDRYIAIPLGLWSSTTDVHMASEFIFENTPGSSKLPFLLKIHVISVPDHLLEFYRQTFPSSMVSSICAVSIKQLSCHAEENEVLLRGPFFQVIRLTDTVLSSQPVRTLEMVTLNTNRDHISTAQLSAEDDARARNLIRWIVTVTRHEFAVNFCERHGMSDDLDGYRKLLTQAKDKLAELMET